VPREASNRLKMRLYCRFSATSPRQIASFGDPQALKPVAREQHEVDATCSLFVRPLMKVTMLTASVRMRSELGVLDGGRATIDC